MEKLDETTLIAMQLTAPGACEKEARQLYARIHGGELFGAFSESERNQIWLRICSATVDSLVPSLHAFFENVKYLEEAADCMRRLVCLEGKESLRCAFEKAFCPDTGDDECVVQVSPSKVKILRNSNADTFDVAYRQLWLYALREYQNMPTERQQKLAMAQAREADEIVVFRFARLAQTLGFNSAKIQALVLQNPDEAIARRLLTIARKPEEFEYDDIASSIKAIKDVLSTARPISVQSQIDENGMESIVKQPALCGRPNADDHARDKSYMYLDRLHEPMQRHRSRLTSYFIQRSIYFAFFGKDIGLSTAELASSESLRTLDFCSRSEQQLPASIPSQLLRRGFEDSGRQEGFQRTITEQERRLELLRTKERELSANIELLENSAAHQESRVILLRAEEQTLLQRIGELKEAEAEQIIRLESLELDERARQIQLSELERRQSGLGDEHQLELLAASETLDSVVEPARRRDNLPGTSPHGGHARAETHEIAVSTPSRRTDLGQMVREALDEGPTDATGDTWPAQEHVSDAATDALEYSMRQGPVNYTGLDNTGAKRKRRGVQSCEERKYTKPTYGGASSHSNLLRS